MSTAQFISVRETAQILSVSEKKVMELIEEKKLQAYKIANKFLRLKKAEVLQLRNSELIISDDKTVQFPYTNSERIIDFLLYNDFYFFSLIVILILLYIIFYA